ncbi:MAG: hypothetical protein WD118_05715, partial [Phycisphaeraceae bacterium]
PHTTATATATGLNRPRILVTSDMMASGMVNSQTKLRDQLNPGPLALLPANQTVPAGLPRSIQYDRHVGDLVGPQKGHACR